ncbi:MAG: hypothetical protein V1668_00715 [Patescibacteria group bacterium]
MEKQKGFSVAAILIAIILVGLVGGLTWYLVAPKEKVVTNANLNIAPVSNKNINSGTADVDTSDWQIFRNNTYDFIIAFPEDWHYISDAMTGPPAPASTFFSSQPRSSSAQYASFHILVSDLMGESLASWAEISSLEADGYQKSAITIDGQTAVRLERRNMESDSGATVYVAKGNYMYRIVWGVTASSLDRASSPVQEAMLKSFKFAAPLISDFIQSGTLSKPAESTVWFILWERPGNPAITKELVFDYQYVTSKCYIGDSSGGCVDALTTGLFNAGDRISVEGVGLPDGRVMVLKMSK